MGRLSLVLAAISFCILISMHLTFGMSQVLHPIGRTQSYSSVHDRNFNQLKISIHRMLPTYLSLFVRSGLNREQCHHSRVTQSRSRSFLHLLLIFSLFSSPRKVGSPITGNKIPAATHSSWIGSITDTYGVQKGACMLLACRFHPSDSERGFSLSLSRELVD